MREENSPFRDNEENESAKKGKPNSYEMYFVLSFTDVIRVYVNNNMRYLYPKQNQYRIQ